MILEVYGDATNFRSYNYPAELPSYSTLGSELYA